MITSLSSRATNSRNAEGQCLFIFCRTLRDERRRAPDKSEGSDIFPAFPLAVWFGYFVQRSRTILKIPKAAINGPAIFMKVPHFFRHASTFVLSLLGETTPNPISETYMPAASEISPSIIEALIVRAKLSIKRLEGNKWSCRDSCRKGDCFLTTSENSIHNARANSPILPVPPWPSSRLSRVTM